MAISPKMLEESFMKDVEELESKLDSILMKMKLSGRSSLSIDVPHGMTTDNFKVLRSRYITAGWKDVSWESDQREGDWLCFRVI